MGGVIKLSNNALQQQDLYDMREGAYGYVIQDIELQERNEGLHSLIYYRCLHSGAVNYGTASELSGSNIFARFTPMHAQSIATLATMELAMETDPVLLHKRYREYAKRCARMFRDLNQ